MKVWLPCIITGTGSQVYTERLARGLSARGHEVVLDLLPHRFQYRPWFAPWSRPDNTDIIIANSWNAGAIPTGGKPLLSICHLVVHDEALQPYKSWPQSLFHRYFVLPMERQSTRKAAVNIAISEYVAQQMKTHLRASRPEVILNGVDTRFFSPGLRQPQIEGRPIRLLFVGKPSRRKGFDIVARIVRELGDGAIFTCVGPAPAGRCPPKGTYTGPVDENALREYYRAADLLLFPSRAEGFGLVAAEAMSCGLPVLACKDTAVAEVVASGCGILHDPDDVEGYVTSIRLLRINPGTLEEMSRLARRHATQHLDEGTWLDRIERVMKTALERT